MKKGAYYVAPLGLIGFIILLLTFEKLQALDTRATEILYDNSILTLFHKYGTFVIVVALVATLVLLIVKKNYKLLGIALLALVGVFAINQIVKSLIGRARPETAGDLTNYSFPSSHTMFSLAIALLFAYMMTLYMKSACKKIAIWLVAIMFVAFMGLSRVAVGHHYLTDVLAGWGLAYSWTVLMIYWYEKKYGPKKKHAFSHLNPYPYA